MIIHGGFAARDLDFVISLRSALVAASAEVTQVKVGRRSDRSKSKANLDPATPRTEQAVQSSPGRLLAQMLN
jgi:hypothetical protein